MSAPVRVVVADDQTVVREGLTTVLGLSDGVEVVGSAADGAEAVRLVAELAPDVVLMDLRMPGVGGVEATRRVRADHPGTQVLVLTTYADDESILGALQAGALGYLTKDAGASEIVGAIQAVARGQALLDPGVQQRLVAAAAGGSGTGTTAPEPPIGLLAPDGLTAREVDVLRLVAKGRSNPEIAADLFVSEATVKTHINHIFAKAGVRDRAQAVEYAYRTGLVAPGP